MLFLLFKVMFLQGIVWLQTLFGSLCKHTKHFFSLIEAENGYVSPSARTCPLTIS